jgi:hypothetical protein
MRKQMAVAGFVIAAFATGIAQAQTVETQAQAGAGKATVEQLTTLRAKVTAIDAANREVTLKGEKGNFVTVPCGPEVKNFAQIAVGDDVEVQYYESLTLKLDKAKDGATAESTTSSEMRAAPGEKPGGITTRETTLTGKVTAVDAAASTVTVVGPKGRSLDLEVEADTLAKIKVGDLVSATYKQALAVSVSKVVVK